MDRPPRLGTADMPIARSHRLLPHTADAGIEATAPDLPALFEEAAAGLAQLSGDVAGERIPRSSSEWVELFAPDLVALAFGWLGELVALVDARRSAIAGTDVEAVEHIRDGWRLAADVRLVPFDGESVRRRDDVKSATYHRLVVQPWEGGWRLTAYMDI